MVDALMTPRGRLDRARLLSGSAAAATASTELPRYSIAATLFTLNHAATLGLGATYGVICTLC